MNDNKVISQINKCKEGKVVEPVESNSLYASEETSLLEFVVLVCYSFKILFC
jgi:hypothetical protein